MTYNPGRHHRRSIRLRGYDYRQVGAYFVTICAQDRQCLFGEIAAGAMRLNDAGRMVERWWGELKLKFPGARADAFVVMPNHVHGIIIITEGKDANANNSNDNESDENAMVGADRRIRPRRMGTDFGAIDAGNIDPIVGSDVAHVDPIADINVGGYADPPLHNETDDFDEHINESNDEAMVGADRRIRPRRDNNDRGAGDVDSMADAGTAINESNAIHPHARFNASLPSIVQWFKIMTTNEYIRGVKQSGWPPFRKRVWQRDYYERIIRSDESLARIRDYIYNNPAQWFQDAENTQKRTTP